MDNTVENSPSWFERPVFGPVKLSWENLLLVALLLLAVLSRFALLEPRVMSHDETIHVYHNSWSLFSGQGYQHDPLSHGPFQTHVVALSYFLFGDSDTSARIPAVLFSIASVAFVWYYRRYLGRAGMFAAMTLMVISPYMLYYGRYVRNESYAAFAGIVLLWAMLRYLETGQARYTYFVSLATVLHFTAKETAFIYTAQALVFLGCYFLYQMWKREWVDPSKRKPVLLALLAGLGLILATEAFLLTHSWAGGPNAAQTAAPAVPGQAVQALPVQGPSPLALGLLALGAVFLVAGFVLMIQGFSWQRLRQERSFGLLALIGSLVLPMLSAFPVFFVGWNVPTNASEVTNLSSLDIWRIAAFLVPFTIAAILIGLVWNRKLWLVNAAIFYAFFTIFYTTVFTNGAGFFTGLVGSLGYWLKQQGVQRGSQPWYYYLAVQIPVYEYLPALGSLLGMFLFAFGQRPLLRFSQAFRSLQQKIALREAQEGELETVDTDNRRPLAPMPAPGDLEPAPLLGLLSFWVVASLLAYTAAGEKMPWLTVHMAWPMILLGGWSFGYLIDTTEFAHFKRLRGGLVLLTLVIFLASFFSAYGVLLGPNPPFAGMALLQLESTSTFMTSLLVALGSGYALWRLLADWNLAQFGRLVLLSMLALFTVLTARTAYQSSFINYDNANELLVYAHSAGGVKEIMTQVEEISRRTTGGLALEVAHDGEYPFWWYLRNYPNARYFGSTPSRSLRDTPVIIVGDSNFSRIEPIVGQAFDSFEYIRLWWPNQDYYDLTWERIRSALTNPEMRAALFQIWLNRDYTKYGQVTGKDMRLENWSPSVRMRLYIRKDITAKLWNYGSSAVPEQILADPYEGKQVVLTADKVWGGPGAQPGFFSRPRDLAFAPDGSLYVADTDNHRIQHLDAVGNVLHVWGQPADIAQSEAPGGTFNQPWGIAVGPDGSVYVADTWNHRVQKFSPEGQFERLWGFFGTGEAADAFWGPRDVAVDASGRVYVTDTGNKRVAVFDKDGNFLTQFGSGGLEQGQFDEPVGLAVDSQGLVYVADTWNQRIQVFREVDGTFVPERMWEIVGWYGQSLDNKPYLAVDALGMVFVVDPEGYRVLQFTSQGEFVRFWGDLGNTNETFGMTGSVAIDSQGGVWVSDPGNSRLMHFNLPPE